MLNVLLSIKAAIKDAVEELFEGHKVDVLGADEDTGRKISENHYDLVLLGERVELITLIKAADPRVEVIFIGRGFADEVEIIRLGASSCFQEPLDLQKLKKSIDVMDDLAEKRRETGDLEKKLCDKYTFAGVVGRNPRMLDLFSFINRIAPYFKTVTITGETGVGKEEIAKALHSINNDSRRPFIACNCGGLLENLIESEFFGYKKGSFTGAIIDKAGIFEASGEGVVFLDEIGDLPLSFQPHLLRVLQNGDFRRIGSNQPLKARCRVIAATNRDLAREVKEGRFREDLFFRLTPLTINVPPLRERKDDIPLLCRFMLDKFYKRTGKKVLGISRPAQTSLMSYDWPGNVRELENVVEQAAILSKEAFVKEDALPEFVRGSVHKKTFVPMSLDDIVKRHIEDVLKENRWNKTHAAKVLGITRRALLRKIQKYSIL